MKCLRCGNEDEKYFYLDKNVYYCRRCIQFGRLDVGQEPQNKMTYVCKKHRIKPKLKFELTSNQKAASSQLVAYFKEGKDSLVYACCGAGKTEITYEVLTYALNQGLKVGFAISRRQVVLEIASRLQGVFKTIKVVPVCEGYTQIVDGDLIVCTMHQLYRYHKTFNLLIMDEVDAFPFKGSDLLESIARHACVGNRVFLTATPTDEMLELVKKDELKMIKLFVRPHGFPLVLPEIKVRPVSVQIIELIRLVTKTLKNPLLIFVPTIRDAVTLSFFFKVFFPCDALTSKTENKEEIIDKFKKGELKFIFATTVLERGITIEGVDIVVLKSNHPVFDEASLIQIIGRVGRSRAHPTGLGIFYCTKVNEAIRACVSSLKEMNEAL